MSANRTPQPGERAAEGCWPAEWIDVQASAAATIVTTVVRQRPSLGVTFGLRGGLRRLLAALARHLLARGSDGPAS
jgi:hypothetical protein